MKIVDNNIISKFCSSEVVFDFSGEIYTTQDLKDEFEISKYASVMFREKLRNVNFLNIENHHYFTEARYLSNYKRLLNKHMKIVSFYGLKGMGDMSILASIATIFGHVQPDLFDRQESVEVVTHDRDLKEALKQEFNERVVVTDPLDLVAMATLATGESPH